MLCPTFLIFGSSRLYGAAGNAEKLHSLEKVSSHTAGSQFYCPIQGYGEKEGVTEVHRKAIRQQVL
jgi:hypothetical protein